MLLQNRIDRIYKQQAEDTQSRPRVSDQDEIYLEKGDFGAMWLAGIQMILLPALLVLLAMVGIGLLIFYI